MNRLKRDALVLQLVDRLREEKSWCGETHIQKAVYLLQELFTVPLGFAFTLYKYGPFSFELRDALTAMRADGLLELQAQWPYGPRFLPSASGAQLRGRFPRTIREHSGQIDFVARQIGESHVQDLEKLATALLVTRIHADASTDRRAVALRKVKPHVTIEEATEAIARIDEVIQQASRV